MPVADTVVEIHASEVAGLCETRVAQLTLAGTSLVSLSQLDRRLTAHLDGLAVAGGATVRLVDKDLESHRLGPSFALAALAFENRSTGDLERLVVNLDTPLAREGLLAACGWVSARDLRGIVRELLAHTEAQQRDLGLAACCMHRTDPGLATGPWLADPEPTVRSRALRATGELGLVDLAPRCVAALADEDPDCRFWAAWSAVLLGNRGVALDALRAEALDPEGRHRPRAFRLAVQAMSSRDAHAFLHSLARDKSAIRWVIQGSGINGDPSYVPWLLGLMDAPDTSRVAAEAFTLITGGDLDAQQLWRDRPEGFESGPTEDTEDEDVSLDPDEGLMWPDPVKVRAWWTANESRFTPGQRYFMGAPVTRAHCIDVLKNGYQRQRILAAHYLCLLDPGTLLFNTSAPAWRQQRLLAKLS